MFSGGLFMQFTDSGRLNQTPYYLSCQRSSSPRWSPSCGRAGDKIDVAERLSCNLLSCVHSPVTRHSFWNSDTEADRRLSTGVTSGYMYIRLRLKIDLDELLPSWCHDSFRCTNLGIAKCSVASATNS